MYKIIRVGIPIQTRFVSPEFLDIVNDIKTNDRVIALTTIDYPENIMDTVDSKSSPAGHKILKNNLTFKKYDGSLNCKCINTMGFVWRENFDGIRRNFPAITKCIINILNNQYIESRFATVYIFAPGSPYYGDSITKYMSQIVELSIVDTPSSMQISLEKMKTYTGNIDHNEIKHQYHLNKIFDLTDTIDRTKLNIFNCLSDDYGNGDIPMMIKFMRVISNQFVDDDLFLVTTVDEDDTYLRVLTVKEAKQLTAQFRELTTPFTVGVISKESIK